ncbi:NERD domain-containing protein [Gracilibacillus salinarum]|uniref:NERD domain-containing protein n=1 Tax=Gracilibacillus salinarum TaxID=2932255 RepID=A0ABY4GQW4_9BACI|nr:NERD domain-containing protein [Gracilibacillus salinarum]UOQ86624.1 NERD domain-containing protein [Gracilibacillus salinarum]
MKNDSVQKSYYLMQLEALVHRLKLQNITQQLDAALGKERSGYIGENKLPYYLSLDSEEKILLYGLRIPWHDHFFQIDCLTIYLNKIFIIEVKHMKGKLSLNEADQLVQEVDENMIEVFDHPLIQAQVQQQKLEAVLHMHNLQHPPIYSLVVFTHPKANLQFQHPDMITAQQLPIRLKSLLRSSDSSSYSISHLKKIAVFLTKHHRDRKVNTLEKFGIPPKQVIRGVFCPNCQQVKAKRIHGTWQCPKCGLKDKTMHIHALRDWAYIFGPTITNKQARYFLEINSIHVVRRLMLLLQLQFSGYKKNRCYHLESIMYHSS